MQMLEIPPEVAPNRLLERVEYLAGDMVLSDPSVRSQTFGSINLLGSILGGDSAVLVPLAGEVAFSAVVSETPATDALSAVSYIYGVASRFVPLQGDSERPVSERWSLDWDPVLKEVDRMLVVDATLGASEEQEVQRQCRHLTEKVEAWFIDGQGSDMVETKYAPDERRRPVVFTAGGANSSSIDRSVLQLASLAGAGFREAHGLVSAEVMTLDGEDQHAPGWTRDETFRAELRVAVKQRIDSGEIEPTVVFGGSGRRVLKRAKDGGPGEIGVVEGYQVPGVELLYPDKGLTEADAMLAGSLRVWDGNPDSLTVEDMPVEGDESPAKLVHFQSSLGIEVTGVFTVGDEANIRGQLNKLAKYEPELFYDRDSFVGGTTAIYVPAQRAIALEFAASNGINFDDIYFLGHAAHAVGIERKVGTLVSEQVKGLLAIRRVASRTAELIERAQRRQMGLGELTIVAAGAAS